MNPRLENALLAVAFMVGSAVWTASTIPTLAPLDGGPLALAWIVVAVVVALIAWRSE